MTDALDLFQAARPPSPRWGEDIRLPASNQSRDLHGLAMDPSSPNYRSRIPPPPCIRCGEDHFPGRSYDHPWTAEVVEVHDEPVAASAVLRRSTPPVPTYDAESHAVALRRVALYVGRGDTYVVAVEAAPDWESMEGGTFRVEAAYVLALVKLARALDIKIVDKTGGDLLMLEQEDVSQHAQNNGRSAARYGSGEPRRQGPVADGPQESLPPGEQQED